MQRLNNSLLFMLLVALLAGCASPAQSLQEGPTSTNAPQATDTPQVEVLSSTPPEDCPVTTAAKQDSFKAPEPYAPDAPWEDIFWYGTDNLWTALNADGVWSGLPDNPEGYTQKIMWWSDLYVLKDELVPALEVTGHRLDAEAPPLKTYGATNAYAADIGDAMLTGVDFPTQGCWEITGRYRESELTFVVWVAP